MSRKRWLTYQEKRKLGRKLGRKRLRKLAEFLREDVPRHRFDMSIYGDLGFTEGKCGTSACALGWTTVCFPRAGIKMVEQRSGDGDATIRFEGSRGIDAAAKFFHLEWSDAHHLFGGEHDITPKQKARQLVDFLEESRMVV